jgi:hypothetical protein
MADLVWQEEEEVAIAVRGALGVWGRLERAMATYW